MTKKLLQPGIVLVLAAAICSFMGLGPLSARRSPQYKDSLPSQPTPKGHQGRSVTNSRGVISFSSGLDNDYYYVNNKNHNGYLYLETNVGAFINEKAIRLPLNLSIVIDHSGSMSGEKMQFALQSAQQLIDRLSPQDYVSVVIYDDVVELLQAPVLARDKAAIKSKIARVQSRGGTNLWGGTEKGYEQVKTNRRSGYINRVLLISDGLANEGLTDEKIIRSKVQQYKDGEGITLSSFGVGLDYNEVLMTDMAEAGAGNYYFIDRPATMAAVFDKELNGMLNAAAQNAELRVQLPKGIQLRKVFGLKYDLKGNEVVLQFRDLFAEDTKGVLMEFAIDEGSTGSFRFSSTLSYEDVTDQSRKSIMNENLLNPAVDSDQYLVYFNERVMQQKVLYLSNENMERAMKEVDNGNYESARSIMSANASYMKSNTQYVSKSEELMRADSASAAYSSKILQAEHLSREDKQYLQKSNRSENYKLRAKKKN